MTDPFDDVAPGNPARVALLRDICRQLARRSPDPVARELATEILTGRLHPREALSSQAYSELFHKAFDTWLDWRDHTPPDELAAAAARAQRWLDRAAHDPPAEQPDVVEEPHHDHHISTLTGTDLHRWLTGTDRGTVTW